MIDHPYVQSGMAWVTRLRLRVVVFVIGIPLATWGAISVGPAWLALPLVGMAVACVTVSVNRLTQRLTSQTCLTCGGDISDIPPHEHGIACPVCGSLNQHSPQHLAQNNPDHNPQLAAIAPDHDAADTNDAHTA